MPSSLESLQSKLWLYVAGPLIALTALVLIVTMRLPQVRMLRAAFRGVRALDERAGGSLPPLAATLLASTASYGAAAAVGAATAVALGGPGAIAWVWLF